MFLSFLQTADAGSGSMAMSLMPIFLIFAIFYFLIIRPQNKKQKETERMISALKKGDKIITIGGIYGVVSSTKDKTVIVKVDDNCKIEFSRSAISSVILDKKATEEAAASQNKGGLLASLFGKKKEEAKPATEPVKSEAKVEETTSSETKTEEVVSSETKSE